MAAGFLSGFGATGAQILEEQSKNDDDVNTYIKKYKAQTSIDNQAKLDYQKALNDQWNSSYIQASSAYAQPNADGSVPVTSLTPTGQAQLASIVNGGNGSGQMSDEPVTDSTVGGSAPAAPQNSIQGSPQAQAPAQGAPTMQQPSTGASAVGTQPIQTVATGIQPTQDDINAAYAQVRMEATEKGQLPSPFTQAQIKQKAQQIALERAQKQTTLAKDTKELTEKKLSATEEKQLGEQQDTLDKLTSLRQNMDTAATILDKGDSLANNAQPFSGKLALTKASLAGVPVVGGLINKDQAAATADYNNLVSQTSLSNLKAIFGARPAATEFNYLTKLNASPNMPVQSQRALLQRTMAQTDVHIQQIQARIDGLKTGNYKNPNAPSASPTNSDTQLKPQDQQSMRAQHDAGIAKANSLLSNYNL